MEQDNVTGFELAADTFSQVIDFPVSKIKGTAAVGNGSEIFST